MENSFPDSKRNLPVIGQGLENAFGFPLRDAEVVSFGVLVLLAYQDKKLIHIRSGVKIVIRQNARNHMDADQSKAPEQSEAAREFERMQSEILKETNLDQEETSK